MKNENNNLPLFALPVFLLVGGRTRLRVFEPRYIKLVKLASQGDGFIISVQAQEHPKPSMLNNQIAGYFGCWVKIVNFDQDEKGTLEIDVQCHKVVHFTFGDRDSDGLTFVNAKVVEHWSEQAKPAEQDKFTEPLYQVIQTTPLLKELYSDIANQGGIWEVARWLEILPLPNKQEYFYQLAYPEAVKTLDNVLY